MSIDLSAVLERLSPERMGPYLRATDGDVNAAILLYEWNTAVSGVGLTRFGGQVGCVDHAALGRLMG